MPYLHDLGISHVYASPYLRARSGSTHGYDVADPNSLNPELGTQRGLRRAWSPSCSSSAWASWSTSCPITWASAIPATIAGCDVLENGPASIYARFFDINWRPSGSTAHATQLKLVVPTLGDQYGKVLENGELQVEYADGAFAIAYYDQRFPVAPDAYPMLLDECRERLEEELGRRHEHVQELASILTALRHLPPRGMLDAAAIEERNREKEIVKRRIARCTRPRRRFARALEDVLRDVQRPGRAMPRSFDRLDALIDDQSYRLAFWRVAAEEINYRRFFDITELAAVRMEDPSVFPDTHRLLLRLVGEGKIQGLRIDHPDGLTRPGALLSPAAGELPGARSGAATRRRFYVVVEKILLRRRSAARGLGRSAGTTGYDFLKSVNGIFVARHNEQFFSTIYFRFLRQGAQRFPDLANSTKKMVMLISLASEVNELGYLLRDIASSDRRHRDFTLNSLTFVIREVIAALGIYRTYIDPETGAAVRRATARRSSTPSPRPTPQPTHRSVDLRLRRRHAAAAHETDARRLTEPAAFHRPLPADHRPGDGQRHRRHRVLLSTTA